MRNKSDQEDLKKMSKMLKTWTQLESKRSNIDVDKVKTVEKTKNDSLVVDEQAGFEQAGRGPGEDA